MQQKKAKVEIRCEFDEKASWVEAAGGSRKLSAWAREVLNRAASNVEQASVPLPAQVDAGSTNGRSAGPDPASGGSTPSPAAIPAGQCPRWFHHKPGVYCGTCKKIQK